MTVNMNPLEDYVNIIKQNTNFLNRLLTPKIGITVVAIFTTIIGVIVIKG
jgi:hypothetical protein